MKINYVDLFCGAGGFSLGLKLASKRFNCVGAIDYYEKAIEIYKHNIEIEDEDLILCKDLRKFPAKDFVKKLESKNINTIDLVIGGPPCPGFSNMGKSKILSLVKSGKWDLNEVSHSYIDDPRNNLFKEYVNYVKYFKPKCFVFENVKGMGAHIMRVDGKEIKTVDLIKKSFINLGYKVEDRVLNAADYGVPQKRNRIFIVGLRDDERSITFPKKEYYDREKKDMKESMTKKQITSYQAIIDLKKFNNFVNKNYYDRKFDYRFSIEEAILRFENHAKKYGKGMFDDENYDEMKEYLELMRKNKFPGVKNRKDRISCHSPRIIKRDDDKKIFQLLKTEIPIEKNSNTVMYKDLEENLKRYKSKGFGDRMRRIPWWRPSWTIVAHLAIDGYMFIHPERFKNGKRIGGQHRSISVREAARLQSFPDAFDFSVGGKVTRGHQFRVIGNAVPPLLGKALGNEIIRYFE